MSSLREHDHKKKYKLKKTKKKYKHESTLAIYIVLKTNSVWELVVVYIS